LLLVLQTSPRLRLNNSKAEQVQALPVQT
jgi:hypothetical protein